MNKWHRPRRLWTDTRERLSRTQWPTTASTSASPDARVAMVTVNYNTLELIAHLLFSVMRVLPKNAISEIVVVDNGSTDGSLEFLRSLHAFGLIHLIENSRYPYHGPGLNRGISYLAQRGRQPATRARLIWVLDSDAIVMAPNSLDRFIQSMAGPDVAMAGQLQPYDQPRPRLSAYAHPAALMIDPAVVWRHRVPAFLEDGAPGVIMQHSLRRRGAKITDVRAFDEGLILHLGSGTLRVLAAEERRDNRYFNWATMHQYHHFHGQENGLAFYENFLADFTRLVPTLDPRLFAATCHETERLSW